LERMFIEKGRGGNQPQIGSVIKSMGSRHLLQFLRHF
jgi:hypothetical protein